jgi:glycosyltransferase involved in cell wall biosynthesis
MIKGRKRLNIGFISTRIAGLDGVSLEIGKWASVLEGMGHRCFYCSGENDRPAELCQLIEEAHFRHPEIEAIGRACFGSNVRGESVSGNVDDLKKKIKAGLRRFIGIFDIDLLIPENCLAIPMNLPLGLALSEVMAETGIAAIAHHHDFFWERERFSVNAAGDYLGAAFPPDLPGVRHVVINSMAARNLAFRKGLSCVTIPNVCDFANRPEEASPAVRDTIRNLAGLHPDDPLILQPTRIVPRKWIERSIDLTARLGMKKPLLVISHQYGDEGDAYRFMLEDYARSKGVALVYLQAIINEGNVKGACSLKNIFSSADFVTYPSGYEGFGDALLEAVYRSRPVMVNRYPVFISDIEPRGFDFCRIDTIITPGTVDMVRNLIADPERRRSMTERNYEVASRLYSFSILEELLASLMATF